MNVNYTSWWYCWALMIAVTYGLGVRPADAQVLTEARYDEVLAELTPPADEPWRSIPWGLSVLEAQRVALEAGKPIFIWAMDGHPLGCV